MKRFSKSTDVQTLLFPMDRFTPSSARAWAERHGFLAYKVDKGGPRSTKIRVRQHTPESYRPGTFRTIPFSHAEGIEAVIGVPKEKRNPSKSAMLRHHLQDVMEATRAGRPDVARYLYREAGMYLPKQRRRNPELWLVVRQDRAPGSAHWMSRSRDWVVRSSLADAKKKAMTEADEYVDAQTGGWKYRVQVFPAVDGKYGIEAVTDKAAATILPSKARAAETDKQRRMERALRMLDYETYNKLRGRKK